MRLTLWLLCLLGAPLFLFGFGTSVVQAGVNTTAASPSLLTQDQLQQIITRNDVNAIDFLVQQRGFHINTPLNDNKDTALHLSVQADSVAITQRLLQHEAQINGSNATGQNPLMLARSAHMVQLLLDHGAHAYWRDHEAYTVAMHLVQNSQSQPEALETLLNYYEQNNTLDFINEKNRLGLTALQLTLKPSPTSTTNISVQKLNRLIDRGIPFDTPDADGLRPLVYAIIYGDIEHVKTLVYKGAHLSSQSFTCPKGCTYGSTPVVWRASWPGLGPIYKKLQMRVDANNFEIAAPLFWSVYAKGTDKLNFLLEKKYQFEASWREPIFIPPTTDPVQAADEAALLDGVDGAQFFEWPHFLDHDAAAHRVLKSAIYLRRHDIIDLFIQKGASLQNHVNELMATYHQGLKYMQGPNKEAKEDYVEDKKLEDLFSSIDTMWPYLSTEQKDHITATSMAFEDLSFLQHLRSKGQSFQVRSQVEDEKNTATSLLHADQSLLKQALKISTQNRPSIVQFLIDKTDYQIQMDEVRLLLEYAARNCLTVVIDKVIQRLDEKPLDEQTEKERSETPSTQARPLESADLSHKQVKDAKPLSDSAWISILHSLVENRNTCKSNQISLDEWDFTFKQLAEPAGCSFWTQHVGRNPCRYKRPQNLNWIR